MPLTVAKTWYWLLLLIIPDAYTDSVIGSMVGVIVSTLLRQAKLNPATNNTNSCLFIPQSYSLRVTDSTTMVMFSASGMKLFGQYR